MLSFHGFVCSLCNYSYSLCRMRLATAQPACPKQHLQWCRILLETADLWAQAQDLWFSQCIYEWHLIQSSSNRHQSSKEAAKKHSLNIIICCGTNKSHVLNSCHYVHKFQAKCGFRTEPLITTVVRWGSKVVELLLVFHAQVFQHEADLLGELFNSKKKLWSFFFLHSLNLLKICKNLDTENYSELTPRMFQ